VTEEAAYPSWRETDVVLRGGGTVHVRPARPEDQDRLEDYFISLSDESRRLRFWGPTVDVREQAARAVRIDYTDHLTLLATEGVGPGERFVGGAQYIRFPGSARAEVALSVSDHLQGQGLGSLLIVQLAEAAHTQGIEFFFAEVLPENHRMIDVFRRTGFHVGIRAQPGAVEIEFPTLLTDRAIETYAERERRAAANAVKGFLRPSSIAVIGASRDPSTIGGRILKNLLGQPFDGVVYPVNPSADHVQGVTAYASVGDIPGEVDLAIVAVPAAFVSEVARGCAEKGVKGLVVISAGFAETDEEGRERQRELLEICRANGMRMIGPNCMGIVNTHPDVRLNGTFAQAYPPEGRVAFMSQSGALGIAVINMATALGMGLSSFVSVGNKADISGNDLLAYWAEDEGTDLVLLYLESFGNPRRFAELARQMAGSKPIVAVKSGRSAAGARASASHTGALLAASDTTVDALFRQVGVIRTDTLEEMFDVAALLANQPVPAGRRVAIVTNAGGLGIQCADTCEARGLHVNELAPDTVERLRGFLPAAAGVANPVDMIASASGEQYGETIRAVAADPGVDAMIVIYIPPIEADAPEIARHMVEAIGEVADRIPVVTCFMSAHGIPDVLTAPGVKIPSYGFPEQAAIAMAHAADLGSWRGRPAGSLPRFPGIRDDEAAAVIAGALARGDDWLEPEEIERLFDCYGLPMARQVRTETPAQAGEAAGSFPGPVALKAVGPVHKTEADAVVLGLPAVRVEAEAEAMSSRIAERGMEVEGFVVQEMVDDGVEMLVGMAADPVFGPVVAVGAGGVTVELTRDIQVRVAPLYDTEAADMIRGLTTFPLLDGFRGDTPKDVRALEDVVLRVSALAAAHPAIVEMDCNPVMVLERGVAIVDARVRVQPPAPETPFAGRGAS
jgi:acetyl coenzyme A synthetase (ADP forming)-like protein